MFDSLETASVKGVQQSPLTFLLDSILQLNHSCSCPHPTSTQGLKKYVSEAGCRTQEAI